MPKKSKSKTKNSPRFNSSLQTFVNCEDAEIFRNSFAVGDDIDPHESLKYMQEMFRGKLDEDVVAMIFSECAYNVDQALETLIALSSDGDTSLKPHLSNNSSEICEHKEVLKAVDNLPEQFVPSSKIYHSSEFSTYDFSPFSSSHNNDIKDETIEHQSNAFVIAQCLTSDVSQNFCSIFTGEEANNITYDKACNRDIKFFNELETVSQEKNKFDSDFIKTKTTSLNYQAPNFFFPENSSYPDYMSKSSDLSVDSISMPWNVTKNSKMFFPSTYSQNRFLSINNAPVFSSAQFVSRTATSFTNNTPQFITPFVSVKDISTVPRRHLNFSKKLNAIETFDANHPRNFCTENNIQYTAKINTVIQKIKNGDKILIILRGLPGSGKSTLAHQLKFFGCIFSTDDYFWKRGRYRFDFSKLSEAHEWNRKRTNSALKKGTTPVIIDNTNTEMWEMKPYVTLGIQYNYEIFILEPNTPWKFKPGELAKRNLHKVSKEKIEKMLERYDHNVNVDKIIKSATRESDCITKSKNELSELVTLPNDSACLDFSNNSQNSIESDVASDNTSENHSLGNSTVISLEADVHQEDITQKWDLDSTLKSQSEYIPEFSNADNDKLPVKKDENNIPVCKIADSQDDSSQYESKLDLKDLKVLMQQDNEETQSCYTSSSENFQETSGWELITERDNDFLWSTTLPSANNKLLKFEETGNSNLNDLESINSVENLSISSVSEQSKYTGDDKDSCKNSSSSSSELDVNDPHIINEKSKELQVTENLDSYNLFPKPNLQWVHKSFLSSPDASVDKTTFSTATHESEINIPEEPEWLTVDSEKARLLWDGEIVNVIENEINDAPKPQRLQNLSSVNYFGLSSINNCFAENVNNPTTITETFDFDSCNFVQNEHINESISNSSGQNECINESIKGNSAQSEWFTEDINSNNSLLTFNQLDNTVSNTEWKFPSFISDGKNVFTNFETSDPSYSCISAETQTDPADFVLLHKIENNDLFVTDAKTLVASQKKCDIETVFETNSASYENPVPKIVCLDKSSSTDDIPDVIGHDLKVEMLHSSFPDISIEDIKHLLDLCHGDNTWLSNILIEWGYKYNVPYKKENELPCLKIVEDSDLITHNYNSSKSNKNSVDFKSNLETKMSKELFQMYKVNAESVETNKYETSSVSSVPLTLLSNNQESTEYDRYPFKEISDLHQLNNESIKTSVHSGFSSSTFSPLLINKKESVGCDKIKDTSEKNEHHIQKLYFTLDSAFALQLEELFGPMSNGEIDLQLPQYRTFEVDMILAKQIYLKWKESLFEQQELEKAGDIGCTEKQEYFDDSFAEKEEQNKPEKEFENNKPAEQNKKISYENNAKQIENIEKETNTLFTHSPKYCNEPLPLSEIMDMEYALQLHKEEKLKSRKPTEESIATKLKRQKLYSMFPGVDIIALDEVFESNNCSISNTLRALEGDIGKPAKLPVENGEATKEWEKDNTYQDFIKEDWSDWIYPDAVLVNSDEQASESPFCYTSESTESLRNEAAVHYCMRQECISKAQSAYCRGMKEVASYYAQKGQYHGDLFREANKRAAQIIAENRNYKLDSSVLDLHGLYVQEAIPLLEKFLKTKKDELKKRSSTDPLAISVVTGRGNHSLRLPKLRPSVISYLTSSGYRYDEIKMGVFNINLMTNSDS